MPTASPTRRFLAVALAALGLASSASAQFKSAKLEKQKRETEQLLTDRGRETMHPGGALDVVGVEQGDNDIRSRTPALERSDRAATKVDVDELRERRLAMYETGAAFHSAPSSSSDAVENDAPDARRPAPAVAPDAGETESSPVSWSFLAMLAAVAALGWRWLKQRDTPDPAARAMHTASAHGASHHAPHADPAHAHPPRPQAAQSKPRAA